MLEKIKFNYEVSENQNNLFTSYHTKYDCMIKYNGKQFSFPYQCNARHMTPNLRDCIECLLMDAYAFDNAVDVFDFADEFGYDIYEDRTKAIKIFKACERAYKRLHKMFTDSELEEIEKEIAE